MIRLFGRVLSLGLFVAAALVAASAVQRQREAQEAVLRELERAEEQLPVELEDVPAPAAPAARSTEPEGGRGERTYYRYQDASGSLHFVDALDRVPESFRADARPIAMATAARTSTPPTPSGRTSARRERPVASAAAAAPARRAAAAAEVVVYTTSWCGWCRKTLAWLDERGIDYENRDIERRDAWREELVEKTGSVSIPVVEIDGQIVRGFDPGRMAELL